MPNMKKRLVIVEDHAIIREGLKSLLDSEATISVVGEAADGIGALQCVQETNPDIVLMDLSLPRVSGVEAIKQIKKRFPDINILTLTVHKSEEYIRAALNAGASGYVLKDSSRSELLIAINTIARGNIYMCPEMSKTVIEGYLQNNTSEDPPSSLDCLTDRERQILKLVAEGYKNKEIAGYLFISMKTVEKHRSNLMRKLDLHSASALTAYCVERGIVDINFAFSS